MIEQGTDAWFAVRAGKITASRIADVMAKTKSGWGAGRKNYMADLTAERLTGTKTSGFTSAAMQHGIDTEPDARASYEFFTDNEVELVGFVDHPAIDMTGASPDGLVGSMGLVEIKCPNTATHIGTLLSEKVPRNHLLQMQWQMACKKRDWCDYVSFDDRMPESMQFFMTRIERDDDLISEIQGVVGGFLKELDEMVSALTDKYESKKAA